jgi:hypothetical protein
LEKKTKLTEIFDQYTEDTITDEQVARVVAPVIARIRANEFRRPAPPVYRSRTYKNAALALMGTFVVSLVVCFTIVVSGQDSGGQYDMTEGEALLVSSQSNGQQVVPNGQQTTTDSGQQTTESSQQTIRSADTPLAVFGVGDDEDTHSLPGRVSIGGKAVQGAEMRLLDADTSEVVDTEVTDTDGGYVFEGFPDGRYKLEIKLPNSLGGIAVVQPDIYVFGEVADETAEDKDVGETAQIDETDETDESEDKGEEEILSAL